MTTKHIQETKLHDRLYIPEEDIDLKPYFWTDKDTPAHTETSETTTRLKHMQETNLNNIEEHIEKVEKDILEKNLELQEGFKAEAIFLETEKDELVAIKNEYHEQRHIKVLSKTFPFFSDYSFLWTNSKIIDPPKKTFKNTKFDVPKIVMYDIDSEKYILKKEIYNRDVSKYIEKKDIKTAKGQIKHKVGKKFITQICDDTPEVEKHEISTYIRGNLNQEQRNKLKEWEKQFESLHLLGASYWSEPSKKNNTLIPIGLLNTSYHGIIGFALDVFDI